MQKCHFSKVEVTPLHGCSPVNWINFRGTPLLKTPLGECFRICGQEYNRCQPRSPVQI